jgi:hypothetical protein
MTVLDGLLIGLGWAFKCLKGPGRVGPSVPIIEPMHQGFSIIGRGKAGRALASAWDCDDVLFSREGRPKGWVLLAVSDDAIEETAAHFSGRCVHISGSCHFPDIPCAHPLTSFDGSPKDWAGTPLALTGDVPKDFVAAFERLGFCGFSLPAEKKALYHAAAVISSGHLSTLCLEAERLLAEAGIELPGQGLWPLVHLSLANVQAHGSAGRTGPFVRRDAATIARDVDALPEAWKRLFVDLGAFY